MGASATALEYVKEKELRYRYETSGQWYKGSIHLHTVGSDGHLTLGALARKYADENYDFISVTEDEVIAYVETHGFDPDLVFESRDPKAWRSVPADDHLCLIDHGGRWEVCYAERGERSQAAEFATRTEAVRNLVRRMMGTAWIGLNAAYRDKHYPGRVLPKSNERTGGVPAIACPSM